jgi:hypothetical protein
VCPQPVPPFAGLEQPAGAAMRALPKAVMLAGLSLGRSLGRPTPALSRQEDIARADGLAIIGDYLGDMFPNLHGH